jgi:hypothetical protein
MDNQAPKSTPSTDRTTRLLRWAIGLLLGLVVLAAGVIGSAYALSPEAIRHPTGTHYHFRLQVINDGKAVNFADPAYQTEFNKDICSVKLTHEPIHFHDGVDQFVHVHWAHMTGGLLLKNYGWNFIGGLPGMLGVRFNDAPKVAPVMIHGNALPKVASGDHYYVYTGDADGYRERSWNDFLSQDINVFMGHPSISARGFWDWLVPAAQAHGDDEALTELNHVVGNVVIFAQKDRPTDAQIKARFEHLVPLPESTCGG